MGLTCAVSEIPARHIAPVVESGDMSTRCAPTFIDEATLNGSPPRRATSPGTVGRNAGSTTADVLDVQEGVLYPALHRLAKRGMLSEEWGETDTGRQAKFYTLTRDGRALLKSEVTRWTRFTRAVGTAIASSKPVTT